MEKAFNVDKTPLAKWLKQYKKELAAYRELQEAVKEVKVRISKLKGRKIKDSDVLTLMTGV